jgi:DNA repair protein RadA/Sms
VNKPRVSYVCQSCGYKNPRWLGRCPECGQYNSLVEELEREPEKHARPRMSEDAPVPITQVQTVERPRFATDIRELDRVLGGGIVVGSVCLIGGDPGIGKSTLILQIGDRLARRGRRVLYVSAEESVAQTRLRADRIDAGAPELFVVCETSLDAIVRHVEALKPAFVVIDSIQMVYTSQLPSAPGTVGQVRECASLLVTLAKRHGISVFLVGHVTKDGAIAGPRTLEHLVDAVFYFEGDRYQSFRILRSVKNRFGSTHEVGIFEMQSSGLREVPNPSELFMSQDRAGRTGSTIVPTLVGTRTLLVEIQALTSHSIFPAPTRRVSGVDANRLAMILAVLERRVGLDVGAENVYANAVGGVAVEEPACDLAIAAAIASTFRNRAAEARTVVAGEVGLAGEIRGVTQIGTRLHEAARLGFTRALVPKENGRGLEAPEGMQVTPVATLREALEAAEIL